MARILSQSFRCVLELHGPALGDGLVGLFKKEGVITGFHRKDEAAVEALEGFDVGSVGTEGVFGHDELDMGVVASQVLDTTAGGVAFAVVFGGAVFSSDHFGGERGSRPCGPGGRGRLPSSEGNRWSCRCGSRFFEGRRRKRPFPTKNSPCRPRPGCSGRLARSSEPGPCRAEAARRSRGRRIERRGAKPRRESRAWCCRQGPSRCGRGRAGCDPEPTSVSRRPEERDLSKKTWQRRSWPHPQRRSPTCLCGDRGSFRTHGVPPSPRRIGIQRLAKSDPGGRRVFAGSHGRLP